MIRISTIFIAICMVLITASLGLILYSVAGLSVSESGLVALTALTFLILYNAVSLRLRDRSDVHGQISDLSQGTADLARQVAEFGRRIGAIETRLAASDTSGQQDRIHSVMGEIGELGSLVQQLADSVAAHDELLSAAARLAATRPSAPAAPPAATPAPVATATTAAPRPAAPVPEPATREQISATPAAPERPAVSAATIQGAITANRIDLYLQPIVSLPQRKVRFYETVSRLRDDNDQVLTAADFIGTAESTGLIGQIDYMVMFRCVQVLRRLHLRSQDIGMFCNVSATTLGNRDVFAQCLDFLEANRSLAHALVFEFRHEALRSLGPVESENLATLARLGYSFSVDNVTDLRIDGRALADRGVRYIKVPASLLLDQKQVSAADIHAADLSSLLERFGINLIAEKIEGERSVIDLLDYEVRFGQGFLFSAPRPLRPENATQAATDKAAAKATNPAPKPAAVAATVQPATKRPVAAEPARLSGNAALARRVAQS
jgi:cyclic-di-GMP phosphodiesterase TipF (flagellum assembly factor)